MKTKSAFKIILICSILAVLFAASGVIVGIKMGSMGKTTALFLIIFAAVGFIISVISGTIFAKKGYRD